MKLPPSKPPNKGSSGPGPKSAPSSRDKPIPRWSRLSGTLRELPSFRIHKRPTHRTLRNRDQRRDSVGRGHRLELSGFRAGVSEDGGASEELSEVMSQVSIEEGGKETFRAPAPTSAGWQLGPSEETDAGSLDYDSNDWHMSLSEGSDKGFVSDQASMGSDEDSGADPADLPDGQPALVERQRKATPDHKDAPEQERMEMNETGTPVPQGQQITTLVHQDLAAAPYSQRYCEIVGGLTFSPTSQTVHDWVMGSYVPPLPVPSDSPPPPSPEQQSAGSRPVPARRDSQSRPDTQRRARGREPPRQTAAGGPRGVTKRSRRRSRGRGFLRRETEENLRIIRELRVELEETPDHYFG